MPYHYATDRPLAEDVLRRLCVGAQVDGVRFGPIPQLLITDHASAKPPVRGQVYLNLGSTWCIYPERPSSLPSGEAAFGELEETEALRQLCELREAVIQDVALGSDAPDLLLTFTDGRVFLLNGRHERYEPWQFGIAFRSDIGTLVVACPGNEVAVWDLPEPDAVTGAMGDLHAPDRHSRAPADTASPSDCVQALYAVISGPPERARDWARFRALCHPDARFLFATRQPDGTPLTQSYDVEAFIREGTREFATRGLWESALGAREEQFGRIAHVFSAYVARLDRADAPVAARGINSIQLVAMPDVGWQIVHVIWDREAPDQLLPAELATPR